MEQIYHNKVFLKHALSTSDFHKTAAQNCETQIITDEPVMQPEDLVKEGIHMVTIEETSLVGMDEASQMSMNEPLVFNKPTNSLQPEAVTTNLSIKTASITLSDSSSQDAADIDLTAIQPPSPPPQTDASATQQVVKTTSVEKPQAAEVVNGDDNTPIIYSTTTKPAEQPTSDTKDSTEESSLAPAPSDIPMPDATHGNTASIDDVANIVYDLDDIPQPPPSPTESEKIRRQEGLNDLAMLGIDADDMAAQCF